MMPRFAVPFALAAVLALSLAVAGAADDGFKTTIKNHVFSPAEIKVPANKRVMITVVNEDATAEEFELLGAQGGESGAREIAGRGAHRPAAAGALPVHRRIS